MLRRMVGPSAQSAFGLSKEVGVSQGTLSRWLRDSLGEMGESGQGRKSKQGQRDPVEQAELVVEANKLEGEELGAFLRQHGLHESDLEQMRAWLRERLDPAVARQEKKASLKTKKADDKRIRKLEREIRRKDKALAEAAALLIFQKKIQALWADADDDTDRSNDD